MAAIKLKNKQSKKTKEKVPACVPCKPKPNNLKKATSCKMDEADLCQAIVD